MLTSTQSGRRRGYRLYRCARKGVPVARAFAIGASGDSSVGPLPVAEGNAERATSGALVSYDAQWRAMRQACQRRRLEHRALRALEGRGGMAAFRRMLGGRACDDQSLIDQLLYEVSAWGEVPAAQFLVRRGASFQGRTLARPLFAAIRSGRLAMVRFLIRCGAPLAGDPVFGTPLSWAAYNGHPAIVRELLACGLDPNEPNPGSDVVPLVMALLRGQTTCAEALLKGGADPNWICREPKDRRYWNVRRDSGRRSCRAYCDPLTFAEAAGNAHAARLLRRFGARHVVRARWGTRHHASHVSGLGPPHPCLSRLRCGGGLAVVKNAGQLNEGRSDERLLRVACRLRRIDVVRHLLKRGAKPGCMFDLPELTGGSLAIARALLDAGEESEYGSLYSALVEAIRASHPRLVRLLLERGAATIAGPEKMLRPGCELSMQTALMEAVACNEIECLRLLLAQGADPNHGCTGFPPAKGGRLPVAAVIEGFYAGFRYGLANPAAHRGGPLHVAVIAGNLCLFRLLLRHGADPDAIPGLDEYVACLCPESLRRRFESSIEAQRRANAVRHALPPESTEQRGAGCR